MERSCELGLRRQRGLHVNPTSTVYQPRDLGWASHFISLTLDFFPCTNGDDANTRLEGSWRYDLILSCSVLPS